MQRNTTIQRIIGSIFSFIFNLLYNQFAWTYDLVAWIVSGGLWNRWAASTLGHIEQDGLTLELGFGPGHLMKKALLSNKNIYGVDISRNMTRICANRLKKANLPLHISQANATQLPFEANTFTEVVATFPAPYILDSKTLSEIHRILQIKGKFIIAPTAWSTSKAPIQRFFSWLFNLSTNTSNPPSANLARALKQIKKHGFTASSELITVERSQVLLITATKIQMNAKILV